MHVSGEVELYEIVCIRASQSWKTFSSSFTAFYEILTDVRFVQLPKADMPIRHINVCTVTTLYKNSIINVFNLGNKNRFEFETTIKGYDTIQPLKEFLA